MAPKADVTTPIGRTHAARRRAAFMPGLVVVLILAGCASKSHGSKEPAVPPQPSGAALAYANPNRNPAVAAELAELANRGAQGKQMTYYRSVECTAALVGVMSRLASQLPEGDHRMVVFRRAVDTFQDRAIALGGKAGIGRDRVIEDIAHTQRVADERERDTLNRQSQQGLMCLYELF